MMKICGLQKTTLLDFPGHVAATVFTGGCNFRCPFCHNSDLLETEIPPLYTENQILSFLTKRSSVLEGVCITGGEPTLQPDLAEFLKKIKELGLLVKLDTNGFRPSVLKNLCRQGLVDYAAMDIKAGKKGYAAAAGIPNLDLKPVEESISFLLENHIPYEFRTTAADGLHGEEDFLSIGPWIAGADQYFIQNFKASDSVLTDGYKGFTKDRLNEFLALVKPFVKNCGLRGIDY